MPLDKLDADYLCEEVAERYDPEEIIDILCFTSEELVEVLRSYIIDNAERFEV